MTDIYVLTCLGCWVKVTAIRHSVRDANQYMQEHPGAGVVAEKYGLIFIGRNDDKGVTNIHEVNNVSTNNRQV